MSIVSSLAAVLRTGSRPPARFSPSPRSFSRAASGRVAASVFGQDPARDRAALDALLRQQDERTQRAARASAAQNSREIGDMVRQLDPVGSAVSETQGRVRETSEGHLGPAQVRPRPHTACTDSVGLRAPERPGPEHPRGYREVRRSSDCRSQSGKPSPGIVSSRAKQRRSSARSPSSETSTMRTCAAVTSIRPRPAKASPSPITTGSTIRTSTPAKRPPSRRLARWLCARSLSGKG